MPQRLAQPIRLAIQWGYLLFMLYVGITFARFLAHFSSRGATPFVERPVAVDGFLPISGLLGLRDWFVSGQLNPIHPAATVILLAALTVSLLLKRSFCSYICPVGTVSELCWKGGFTLFKGNRSLPRWADLLLRSIKYLLLAFFVTSIFLLMPGPAVREFIFSDYNAMADRRLFDFFLAPSLTLLIFLTVITGLSLVLRNPFCRFFCPYGALLGLVSLMSPLKVTRSVTHCISCGACNQVCPSHLPIMQKRRMRSAECIGCYRCISFCKADGALTMKLAWTDVAFGALLFSTLVVLLFVGVTIWGRMTGQWESALGYADYLRLLGG
ncbi:MAG TPA: 4Fe-4S binding protein [Geobacterales bacterium]|nr:4Fe-4S binding protein [Geobacterales bacterium]